MESPPKSLLQQAELSGDFVCLLESLVEDVLLREGKLPQQLPVTWLPVEKFRPYLCEELIHWQSDDWSVVRQLIPKFVQRRWHSIPPLISYRGTLRDGFHRVCAMLIAGQHSWWVINLEDIGKEMVRENLSVRED